MQEPIKEQPEEIEQQKKPKRTRKVREYTLLTMLVYVLIFVTIITTIYYLSPFEIVSVSTSSMEPALPVGSISIAVKANEDTEYQIGDIITFSVEYGGIYYSRVTHRIVAIDGDTIQTKGDNNPGNDPFTINQSQIRNVVKWINIFRQE